jgi:hypothetical protein
LFRLVIATVHGDEVVIPRRIISSSIPVVRAEAVDAKDFTQVHAVCICIARRHARRRRRRRLRFVRPSFLIKLGFRR